MTAAPTAVGPEIKEPTLTQQLMLDAPLADDLCVISARGTGKSWGLHWWWPGMPLTSKPNTAA